MRKALAVAGVALVALVQSATAKVPTDFAAVALNVLPPGQSGSLAFPPTATDQAKLYDALTPMFDRVNPTNYARNFKSERFGLAPGEKPKRVEHPRRGLTILRDRWDVPHVYGKTRYDVEFGAGWASAEDRLLLMQLLRGPGRIAALDVPNLNPIALALSAQEFVPTAETEAELAKQVTLLRRTAKGRQVLKDVDAYIAGINAYIKSTGDYVPHWTRNDVIAVSAIIGAQFGVGGGGEARRSEFLGALQARLGAVKGRAVWDDLRSLQDPETTVSVETRATAHEPSGDGSGSVIPDDGTLVGAATTAFRTRASNALLITAKRSKTGHPLFVAGPQVGYAFPELLLELDLHGGGIDARGAAFPGISFYILLGRGKDFAWSATSADGDVVDNFAETLCGGDDAHYLYKGECRPMATVTAGVLKGRGGQPDRTLTYRTTVHGPVFGYASVGGQRVALSAQRSTRGREVLSAVSFEALNTNRVRDARSFIRTMSGFELTFNWFYADSRHIAMFTSGRIPIRAPNTVWGLLTKGTGEYEWRGFVPAKDHPQQIDPKNGTILNWNNKAARGWAAADDVWSYQSRFRVDLLRDALPKGKLTLADVVRAMNVAATQDIRAVEVWPTISEVLHGGTAPSARAATMVQLLDAWHQAGGSRLDRELDGKIDDPGAAILDAAWPRLADAVLSPVIGPLTDRLAQQMITRNQPANPGGSAYASGWYGYVDKDLRTLLGKSVLGRYSTAYCGNGDLAACRVSLWAALDAAGAELAASQGPDPAAWRADATRERITFGLLPLTMRWVNRPTFQQVIGFRSHR